MRIAIDIDRTLLDCNSILYRFANFVLPKQNINKKLKYKNVDDKDVGKEDFFSRFSKVHNHRYYKMNENAGEMINEWYKKGHEIVLLSSRPASKRLATVLVTCINKFNIHFSEIVVACNNKTSYCKNTNVDIIIDNSADTCQKCQNKGINAICYTINSRKSKKMKNKNFVVATSWEEINMEVNKLINKKSR